MFLLTEANLMFSCTGSVRMLLLISKMAKIAYPAPGEISNVVGEERCIGQTPKSNQMSLSQFVLRHDNVTLLSF